MAHTHGHTRRRKWGVHLQLQDERERGEKGKRQEYRREHVLHMRVQTPNKSGHEYERNHTIEYTTEWMFSTPAGHLSLTKSAGFSPMPDSLERLERVRFLPKDSLALLFYDILVLSRAMSDVADGASPASDLPGPSQNDSVRHCTGCGVPVKNHPGPNGALKCVFALIKKLSTRVEKLEDYLRTSERLREEQLRKADERHASLLHTVMILTEEVEELQSRRDSTEYPRNPADEPNDSSCKVLTSQAAVSSESYSTVLAANITVNNELEESACPESASRGNDDGQEMKRPAVDTKRSKPQAVEHKPEPESEWVKPHKDAESQADECTQ